MSYRIMLYLALLLFLYPRHLPAEPPVRVGVIMGFTGSFAPIAEEMRRGMIIAAEEAKNLQLIFEDDHGLDSKATVAAFTKLVSMDHVPVVLNWVNTTMPGIAPLAQRHRVPIIEFWDSNREMLKLGDYVFCSGNSTEKSSLRMAEFAFGPQAVKRMALIVANDPWSELAAASFAEKFKKLGGEIIYEAGINPDEQDLKAVLSKVRAARAEAIFAPLFGNSLYNTIQQARDLNVGAKIFTADGFVESDIEVLKGAAEGVYSLQTIVDARPFLDRYVKTYGQPKSKVQLGYAALAYDGVSIVGKAVGDLRTAKQEVSGQTLRDYFKSLRYEGISGVAVLGGESEKVERIVQVRGAVFEPAE